MRSVTKVEHQAMARSIPKHNTQLTGAVIVMDAKGIFEPSYAGCRRAAKRTRCRNHTRGAYVAWTCGLSADAYANLVMRT